MIGSSHLEKGNLHKACKLYFYLVLTAGDLSDNPMLVQNLTADLQWLLETGLESRLHHGTPSSVTAPPALSWWPQLSCGTPGSVVSPMVLSQCKRLHLGPPALSRRPWLRQDTPSSVTAPTAPSLCPRRRRGSRGSVAAPAALSRRPRRHCGTHGTLWGWRPWWSCPSFFF